MIMTTDGRFIPFACRHCHINSQALNGLCRACLADQGGTGGQAHQLPAGGSAAQVERTQIARAKERVRSMGLT